MLYIFGGLPGAGKSTLSRHLAREVRAVHLRVDTITHAIRESGGTLHGPEGYAVAHRVAEDNLRLGLPVVADTVNPVEESRRAWRDVALRTDSAFVEIEVLCSDRSEHRARVESRVADIAGYRLPTWAEVVNRHYEPWESDRLVIDTAGQRPEESIAALIAALARK